MTTPRELITGALRLINVVQANEVPSAQDMDISLEALNNMLDSWSNDKLTIFSMNPYEFATVPGKRDYTLGTGGDWDIERPMEPMMMYVMYYPNGYPTPVPPPVTPSFSYWRVDGATQEEPVGDPTLTGNATTAITYTYTAGTYTGNGTIQTTYTNPVTFPGNYLSMNVVAKRTATFLQPVISFNDANGDGYTLQIIAPYFDATSRAVVSKVVNGSGTTIASSDDFTAGSATAEVTFSDDGTNYTFTFNGTAIGTGASVITADFPAGDIETVTIESNNDEIVYSGYVNGIDIPPPDACTYISAELDGNTTDLFHFATAGLLCINSADTLNNVDLTGNVSGMTQSAVTAPCSDYALFTGDLRGEQFTFSQSTAV